MTWQWINWRHKLFIAAQWQLPLQRIEQFPGVSPSLHSTIVRSNPWLWSYLSDCSLHGRPCPLVTILSRCLPALRPPSSAGCANWPTVDKCIKVDSDYNWSLRTNFTRWNSDNMITQLTVDRFIYQDATGGQADLVLKRLWNTIPPWRQREGGDEVNWSTAVQWL